MNVLPVSPDAPALIRYGADALLFLHVGGASMGLLSGTAVLVAPKGTRFHRTAGSVFTVSMLTMAAVGAAVAPFLHDRPSTVAGVLAFYLVLTGWMTMRRKEGTVGHFEQIVLLVPLAIAAAGALFIAKAAADPSGTIDGEPPQSLYLFLLVGSIAALSDIKVLLRGGITGGTRVARHLWRMCAAYCIASASFFLGQQKFLPASLHNSPLLFIPVFLPLLMLFVWLVKVRLPRRPQRIAVASVS